MLAPCLRAFSSQAATGADEAPWLHRLASLPAHPRLSSASASVAATKDPSERLRGLVALRASLMQTIRHARDPNEQHLRNELRAIADGLKDVLSERFDPHSLLLTQIERTSPLTVLQKVVDTESVHPLASVDAFKARLGKGRKCWAFFHPLLPEEPLVYINVAFEPRIATSMKEIYLDEAQRLDPEEAKAAIFYSIVTTQPGLKGVDLPHQLIKWTSRYLHQQYKGLTEFSTLSPIPGFMPWLRLSLSSPSPSSPSLAERKAWLKAMLPAKVEVVAKELGISSSVPPQEALVEALENHRWFENERVVGALQPLMLRLCAHYVITERAVNGSTQALDRVANFHLGNGAYVHGLNWMADLAPLRLSESASLMANYKYPSPADATTGAADAALYHREGIIKASPDVEALLRDRW